MYLQTKSSKLINCCRSLKYSFFIFSLAAAPPAQAICDNTDSTIDVICERVSDTWQQGENDFYLPFHAHHLRSAYSDERIDSFREENWGLGYGRSRYDESGNWDGLYVMGFMDSNSKPEYFLGYSHQWIWGERERLHAGLGYTAFLTARSSILHYTPVPGILPVASINYNRVSLNATYVPGGGDFGNIIFFWSRIGF